VVTDVHGALVAQVELLDHLLTPDPPPRRRWPLLVLALVLVLGTVGAVAALRLTRGPEGPPHPARWDARVQKYVDFVEKRRDLRFEHPVYVDFLPDAEFTDLVTADRDDLGDDQVQELTAYTGMFRALGLLEGDVDLLEEANQLRGSAVIGFYSYDDERLRIRGTELTPAVESTLVHELTHALQDQTFDLARRFAELAEADDADSSAASDGFDALVEGDARRVEGMWRDHLSEADRAALDKEQKKAAKGARAGAADVPEVLSTMLAAPYDLGQALLAVAVEQGGQSAVDDLFRSPPRTEEQQLDPWTLVADHQGYLSVPEPDLPAGQETFEDGAFGALGWLLLLSERMPAQRALTAVDGWGGDALAAYDQDGTSCVTIDFRADTAADLAQMQRALQTWVAKGPREAASVEREDQTLVLRSCDPGADAAPVASGTSADAVGLALTRTYLSLGLLRSGLDVATARCGADRMVRTFSPAQLRGDGLAPEQVRRVVLPCRDRTRA